VSGGDARFAIPLMRAAVACGVDALFFEAHPDPRARAVRRRHPASARRGRAFLDEARAIARRRLRAHPCLTSPANDRSKRGRGSATTVRKQDAGARSRDARAPHEPTPKLSIDELLLEPIAAGADPVPRRRRHADRRRDRLHADHDCAHFWVRDGLALQWARDLGVLPVVISGRDSRAVEARMRDLGIECYLGVKDKVAWRIA
jgi:hypothetical protein